MAKTPVPLHSASALTDAERTVRQAFEQRVRDLSDEEAKGAAVQDFARWRGVAEQLITMVESDLKHERRVRSARISERLAAVADALRGSSSETLRTAVGDLADEVWGGEPDPDDPMNPALAQRRRAR